MLGNWSNRKPRLRKAALRLLFPRTSMWVNRWMVTEKPRVLSTIRPCLNPVLAATPGCPVLALKRQAKRQRWSIHGKVELLNCDSLPPEHILLCPKAGSKC